MCLLYLQACIRQWCSSPLPVFSLTVSWVLPSHSFRTDPPHHSSPALIPSRNYIFCNTNLSIIPPLVEELRLLLPLKISGSRTSILLHTSPLHLHVASSISFYSFKTLLLLSFTSSTLTFLLTVKVDVALSRPCPRAPLVSQTEE